MAAEIIGVELGRYKVGAFALSSGLAAMGGALLGAYQQFVSPDEFSLFLSIQYIAIIIVGGVGTIFGSVLGALFLGGLPAVIEEYSGSIPGVAIERRRRGLHLRVHAQPGHLRPADRAVPGLRAAWAGRHVAAC